MRLDSTTNSVGFDFKGRNIRLFVVKLGKQVPFRVYIHLIGFSIVTLSHVTHICLITVQMFTENGEYLVKLYSPYFVVFLWFLVRDSECYLIF